MKTALPALVALLEQSGARRFWSTRAVEIVTRYGFTLRYTEADVSLQFPEKGAAVFRHDGARVTIGAVSEKPGLQVDDLTIKLAPIDTAGGTDPGVTGTVAQPLLPAPLLIAAQNGLFSAGASVTVWRAFAPMPGPILDPTFTDPNALLPNNVNASPQSRVLIFNATGALERFTGYVGKVTVPTETRIELTVKSALNLLAADFPRYVYRPGCVWPLFGTGCGLRREDFELPGAVAIGSTLSSIRADAVRTVGARNKPPGYFDEGVIRFTTGLNSFVRRTVKQHPGDGNFELTMPLPYPPAQGDQFVLSPGCDKTYGGGCAKLSNQARYRGFPNVPPEAAITGTKMKDLTDVVVKVPETDPES